MEGQAYVNSRDLKEKDDGDPLVSPKALVKIPSTPKVDLLAAKWSFLFGIKPKGKSSFPTIKILLEAAQGSCAIAIGGS